MEDKQAIEEQEALEQAKLERERVRHYNVIDEEKRVKSFENTGATLTIDNRIILAHASDADFNANECFTEYLRWHLQKVGAEKFAEEANMTTKQLLDELLANCGDDVCQSIVNNHFTKKVL